MVHACLRRPRGQRGILHGCFRVKWGSAQTVHVSGAPCCGVAVQAAATAACGGSEGEVVPQTDLAVEELEQGRGPSTTSFIVSCPTSVITTEDASLRFGGEPARAATHAKLGVKHGELVSHLLHGGCSGDKNEPRPPLADYSCGGGKAVLVESMAWEAQVWFVCRSAEAVAYDEDERVGGGQGRGEGRRQVDILVANDRVVDDVQCTISECLAVLGWRGVSKLIVQLAVGNGGCGWACRCGWG
ncbi:hypothetical protein FN846DRAFT_924371 [Sphaerosporella brunnea]|uniref:Uncharacterized protein n=1 Tax=Sphaerosporella brunnea TaxID=1250544 RepID=A0A5J5FBY9_9PEZI|nr:hypothetical protein FN846DRAFT_924371 [Sphaerosporella brunnea]